jgi:UDP-N-acetylmuramate--alanine ligase
MTAILSFAILPDPLPVNAYRDIPVNTSSLKHVKRIHFIGIGGAGMGGIAEVLLSQGYQVSGSDLNAGAMVQRLRDLGAQIAIGHQAENIANADVIVVSTAIHTDNPELVAAQQAHIPVIPRAQMLADIMRNKRGIAVAGTHGKTTTTSLLASVLTEAGLDPTFVIGGLLKSAGANAYLGKSPFFVAEADESDASFLYLYPEIAIITNIDADHMATYDNDFDKLCDTFNQFLHRLPFNGLAVACLDDPIIAKLLPRVARPILTYGFHTDADVQIKDFHAEGFQSHFTLVLNRINREATSRELKITLNLPGLHNVLNAAAVCAVAASLEVSDIAITQALTQFTGVGRRMQVYGELPVEGGHVLVVDDYGHHPREIAATWAAARQAWPDRRLVVLYQPHRYTRTHDLFNDFVEVLSTQPDQLLLLDIYSAGETPIIGADGPSLFAAVAAKSQSNPLFISNLEDINMVLQQVLQPGDVLLTQGAGNVGAIAPRLMGEGIVAPEKLAANL